MTAGVFRSLAVSAARVLEADAQADGGIEIYWDAARLYQESGEKQLAYATMMRCAEYSSRSGATQESCRAFAAAVAIASSPSALYNALSGQLHGLHAMGEYATALPVVEQLRGLCSEHPMYAFSAEQEIYALEIAHFSGASDDMATSLKQLAADQSLSPDCRLHAIRIGLVTADNSNDREAQKSFRDYLTSFTESPEDMLYLLRAQIVNWTIDGQFERAREVSSQLLSEARRRSNRTALLADLRFCSIPSRRGGELNTAYALLDESQILAQKFGFSYGQFRAADMKAGLLLDYYRLPEAEAALLEAKSLLYDSLGSFMRESLDLTWAFWSLASDDWEGARQRALNISAVDLTNRSRHAMLSAALRLRLATRRGSREDAERILRHLTGSHIDVLCHGGSDQIALAIYEALGFLHGAQQANTFALDYVGTKRKERFAPPPQLQIT